VAVIEACEAEGVEYKLTGAFATSAYGIPRSTKDVDVVLSVEGKDSVACVSRRLEPLVTFDPQVQFDTLTWGRRLVGVANEPPPFKVELFDDPFVRIQFERRFLMVSGQLNRSTWLPTPEDVIVQKLRWGRVKDLEDARDVLAVQGPESLDMSYIEQWCETHGTGQRLREALAGIPPLD
jgi:hypothetical protein